MPFLPKEFTPPARVEHERFTVRPINIHDAFKDYDAVMSSYDHLRKMFGEAWGWPSEALTLEQNIIDLGWHYKEYQLKSSFDYAVMSRDDSRLLGCIYIDPTDRAGYGAEVCYWVRADELANGLDDILKDFVESWIDNEWPFEKVGYPGRAVSWEEWDSLPDG